MNKNNFKEQRTYDATAVDNEIAILEQSRNFWKKRAKELENQK